MATCKLGYQHEFFDMGSTAFSVDYYFGNDSRREPGPTAHRWGWLRFRISTTTICSSGRYGATTTMKTTMATTTMGRPSSEELFSSSDVLAYFGSAAQMGTA